MPSRPATKRRRSRRISDKYRPYLRDFAQIYVETGEVAAEAGRRVVDKLKLTSVRGETFRRWLEDPEFMAHVRTERERQANEARTEPAVRGPDKLAWLCAVDAKLRELHEGEENAKEKLIVLKAVHSNGAEIRAEERHYEDLKDRAARRDFAEFLRNFIRWLKRDYASAFKIMQPIIGKALKNLDQIVAGVETVE